VEIPALQRAEQECSLDAEERAKARAAGAARRQREDRELTVRMAASIRSVFPGCLSAFRGLSPKMRSRKKCSFSRGLKAGLWRLNQRHDSAPGFRPELSGMCKISGPPA
jgi:hypothetical protein